MNSLNIRKIEIIVKDLLEEFEKESGKLQAEYDDNVARILEIEEDIHNYKENEDVDFQVFSPRKIDNQNEEKIYSMNMEKDNIESSNKSLYRQIKYYTEKKEKLYEILSIIEEDRDLANIITKDETESTQMPVIEDITKVDEKILAYYDSIAKQDDDKYPEEPENIGNELKGGWRLIKDELDEPIKSVKGYSIFSESEQEKIENENKEDNSDILLSLQNMTSKLENETKKLEEDYMKTKNEINNVINDINSVLEKLKK